MTENTENQEDDFSFDFEDSTTEDAPEVVFDEPAEEVEPVEPADSESAVNAEDESEEEELETVPYGGPYLNEVEANLHGPKVYNESGEEIEPELVETTPEYVLPDLNGPDLSGHESDETEETNEEEETNE